MERNLKKEPQMKLLLTRHGETDWNLQRRIQGSTDKDLNETGRRQAMQLAESLLLSEDRPDIVYTSGLKRALKTAEIAAKRLQIPCLIHPGLEEIGFGLWEGLTWEQVEDKYPELYQIWHTDRRYGHPPEGESYQDLLNRVVPALQDIIQKEGGSSADRRILIVTHSAVIMSLLSHLNRTPFHEMVKRYRTQNAQIIELDAKRLEE